MNTNTREPIYERSTVIRAVRWLGTWRGIRTILLVMVWPVTLIVLFYAIENFRGSRAWNKYRKQLEQQGEKLSFSAFVPQPVTDADNFAAIPEIRSWFDQSASETNKNQWNDAYARAASMVPQSRGNYKGPRVPTDLVAWEQAFAAAREGQANDTFSSDRLDPVSRQKAAPAVLESLKDYSELFEQLRDRSKRPRSVYPIEYNEVTPWAIRLPHLAQLRNIAQRLQLKASAELAADHAAPALADVQLILALSDSLREEKFLVSHLVRITLAQIAFQPIWEGLADHRWTAPQLERLQQELAQRNFLPEKDSLASERVGGLNSIDYIRQHGSYDMFGGSDSIEPGVACLARIAPRGWYAFEKRNYARLLAQTIDSGWDHDAKHVDPSIVDANQNIVQDELAISGFRKLLKHRIAASVLIPAVSKVIRRSAVAQTVSSQAQVACALERFRLEHNRYPDQLKDLVPQYMQKLSHDVIKGEAMIYQLIPERGYRLYSVGWNQKDDGGTPTHPVPNEQSPDWVWQITPTGQS